MPNNKLFFNRPTFTGRDFCEMLEVLQPYFQFSAELQGAGNNFNWAADTVPTNSVNVWRLELNTNCRMQRESQTEMLYLIFPMEGAFDVTVNNETLRALPGQAIIGSTADQAEALCNDIHRRVTLQFPKSVVAHHLTALFGHGTTLRDLGLNNLVDLNAGVGQSLYLLATAIVSSLYGNQVLTQSPKALSLLTEGILQIILENIPHRHSSLLEKHSSAAPPRHVKNAIDYMRQNLHRPLTISDVAKACQVSSRSLQLGFQKEFNTTPLRYLRRLQLMAAHAELSAPDNKLPIESIARKWGFTHPGRFTQYYKELFGQPPSRTVNAAYRCR